MIYDPIPDFNCNDPTPAPIPRKPSWIGRIFRRTPKMETREEHWRKVIAPAASERVNFWSRHGL